MTLLDLSDDILLELWHHVEPSDIVNFALANRRIHHLGFKRLADHQALVKKYTIVCINGLNTCNHGRGCTFIASHPVDLLVAVADRPVVASYIRSITLVRAGNVRAEASQKLVEHQLLERLGHDDRTYE